MNNCTIYLSSIETIFNSWKMYLLLSETTKNLRYRCAPLSETIGGLGYMCDRVGAHLIDGRCRNLLLSETIRD